MPDVVDTTNRRDPVHCPFRPAASIVLDPFPVERFGRANLEAYCAKDRRSRVSQRKMPDGAPSGCHIEGDYVYFSHRFLAYQLVSLCPLFRRPPGDEEHWRREP